MECVMMNHMHTVIIGTKFVTKIHTAVSRDVTFQLSSYTVSTLI